MKYMKRIFPVTIITLIAFAVIGCSIPGITSDTPTSTATTATTPTTASTATVGVVPTGTVGTSKGIVSTAMVSVKGTSKTVLTRAKGKTLYYHTNDTATTSQCTGTCARTWLPLRLAKGTPASSTTLPHMLSVFKGANGNQVEYDSHLLYTFSGDKGPGLATGEGIKSFGGIWHVATPDL